MNRSALLTALAPVEQLEQVVVPKSGGSSAFVIAEDGLYWQPAGIGDQYKVGREAAAQALRHVPGLSAPAIKEWPTDLLMGPLNWWYQNGDGDVRALISDDEVLSFTKKADGHVQSPVQMLEGVEEALFEKGVETDSLYYDKVRVGLDRTSFAVITGGREEAVKVGDLMNPGVMVFGSPTGAAHTEVSPYLNRLVCTNGMVSPVAMQRWSRTAGTDGGSIFDWTKEVTLSSWDAIDGELDAVKALTEVPVNGNVAGVLGDLFERHHVPGGMREAVLEAAVEEADGTMFGIAQAFNRVANTVEDVAGMRHLLMVTGDVAHQTERCSACLRIVN